MLGNAMKWAQGAARPYMGGTLTSAWTNLAEHGSAHLTRAAGGAAAGAAANMGIHAATGLAGIPTSMMGLTNNDLSMGSMIGAGVRGAAFGGVLGAAAVKASPHFAKAGRVKFQQAIPKGSRMGLNQMYQEARAFTPLKFNDPGTLRPWAQKTLNVTGRLAGNRAIAPAQRLPGVIGDHVTAGATLSANQGIGTRISNLAKDGWQSVRHNGMGSAMSTMGSVGAMGGMVHSAYSSNALGLAIPSNYGYR